MLTDHLLTVIRAAEFLGISPWTMGHWISDGKIEFVKVRQRPGASEAIRYSTD